MAYPDEIIVILSAQYHLSETEQKQLHHFLSIEEVHRAIEEEKFDPALLIVQVDEKTTYIPSSVMNSYLLSHLEQLQGLRDYAVHYAHEMKEYIAIKNDLVRVEILSISRPIERTERKILLREISNRLMACYEFIFKNSFLCWEVAHLSKSLTLSLNAENKWIEKAARVYFEDKFQKESKKILEVSFLSKIEGVQLGNRMLIIYLDAEGIKKQIVYYIKTHQYGSLKAGGSTTVPVDLKELLVYKIFEYAGFGPKAYFFFNPFSPSAFFIATQDEGFTKVRDKTRFFKTYGQARRDLKDFEAGPISKTVEEGLARLDILTKILNLWDIISNSGNYGFINVNQLREKWRVIDFRVGTLERYNIEDIFEKFQQGEGMVGYLGLANTTLTQASPEKRIDLARSLLEELTQGRLYQSREGRKMPLSQAIMEAFRDITDYLAIHSQALHMDLAPVLSDLKQYVEDVQMNLIDFVAGIKTCTLCVESKEENAAKPCRPTVGSS